MATPTAPFKGLLQFRDTTTAHGWTESLWVRGADFSSALGALAEIAERRLALVPAGVRLDRICVTNPRVPRASFDRDLRRPGAYPSNQPRHPATTILRVRLQGGDYHAPYNLGGLPGDVPASGSPLPEAWKAAFDLFAGAVRRHGVLVNQSRLPPGPRPDNIAGAAQDQGGRAVLTLTAETFSAGQFNRPLTVRVSGVRAVPALNKRLVVVPEDATHCLTWHPVAVPAPVGPGGRLALLREPVFTPIEHVLLGAVSARKRGLGHSYRRGRRPNRPRG